MSTMKITTGIWKGNLNQGTGGKGTGDQYKRGVVGYHTYSSPIRNVIIISYKDQEVQEGTRG